MLGHTAAMLIVSIASATTSTHALARSDPDPAPAPVSIVDALEAGAAHILAKEERAGEWPYEGVYRVRGEIPIGYRVGGTGLCCLALARAAGFEDDAPRRDAVARGVRFIVEATSDPLMSPEYNGGYDVRGWGYAYGALLLLELERAGHMPDELAQPAREAAGFYVDAIERTTIPSVGGWNYARPRGDVTSPPSSFMTASTLQTLFIAQSLGHDVDAEVVDRALQFLSSTQTPAGEVVYSGPARGRSGGIPGAVGRMVIGDTTLYLAGRASRDRVRGALDAFLAHWSWLEKRRAKPGTHEPPYGVAPYYFFYAHYYAAQAAEALDERDRPEYRRRIAELLMSIRADDGSWNDRVFDRSSNYGTAMAVMALRMPAVGLPPSWPLEDEPIKAEPQEDDR